MTSLTVVTPWLHHPELAADYVDAVIPELQSGDRVIIVDNGGAPDIPYTFPYRARENLGFARGSNLGLELADTDAVLFLNNDIQRLGHRWLQKIRDALEPGVLVGPVLDPDHAIVDGVRFPYIAGWCLAGMTIDLTALGGFDSTLKEPAYYSDNLLCLEARQAGMRLRHVTIALRHKLSQTAGPDGNPSAAPAAAANRALYLSRARSVLVNL